MKVLYLGHWKDGSGWANAAQDYILALDTAGVEVVPRAIKLNEVNGEVPERIQELEQQSDKECDVVIQHILPHLMDYNGRFDKNIGLYVTETSHCNNTVWTERLNLMDELWVPNYSMLQNAFNSFIENTIYVVPHACDTSKYQKEYEPLKIPVLEDKFIFYYIGELTRRKNLHTLIKAFHLEFGKDEPVALLLKTHLPGKSAQEADNHLKTICDAIKDGLKLYIDRGLYHEEVFICQYLTNDQIMQVHTTGDCFVTATFGEAWGIPIFDAMAMGKTPLCTNTGGPKDFLDSSLLIESFDEPCFGITDSFQEMYVGNECWDSPVLLDLCKQMRFRYENTFDDRKKLASLGIAKAYEYSHYNVGMLMKEILEGEKKPNTPHNDLIKKEHDIEGLVTV
jgi:glycosyltransferase involved in cell wall biosynthesis